MVMETEVVGAQRSNPEYNFLASSKVAMEQQFVVQIGRDVQPMIRQAGVGLDPDVHGTTGLRGFQSFRLKIRTGSVTRSANAHSRNSLRPHRNPQLARVPGGNVSIGRHLTSAVLRGPTARPPRGRAPPGAPARIAGVEYPAGGAPAALRRAGRCALRRQRYKCRKPSAGPAGSGR